MYRARKRRSWQIELPHIGEVFSGRYWTRKAMSSASTSASLCLAAFTLSINPVFLCVDLFLDPCDRVLVRLMHDLHGASTTVTSRESVTTIATSRTRRHPAQAAHFHVDPDQITGVLCHNPR